MVWTCAMKICICTNAMSRKDKWVAKNDVDTCYNENNMVIRYVSGHMALVRVKRHRRIDIDDPN